MMTLTIQDRADAYHAAFPDRPPLQVVREQKRDVLYGFWLGGQDYRGTSSFYGAYPPGFLDRVMCLFPDIDLYPDIRQAVLHAFSGQLPEGPYMRCDLVQPAELRCSVYDLPEVSSNRWSLILSDPPYSAQDAKRYGTPPVDRCRALRALAGVTAPGGFLVHLDTTWPIHSKRDWVTVGRITLVRSTNHRVRLVSIFQRQ